MRSLASAVAALLVLSLPLLARAGDGCPYAEKATTASLDAPAAAAVHAGTCTASCPHAASAPEAGTSGCSCAGEAAAARQADDADRAPREAPAAGAARAVATND